MSQPPPALSQSTLLPPYVSQKPPPPPPYVSHPIPRPPLSQPNPLPPVPRYLSHTPPPPWPISATPHPIPRPPLSQPNPLPPVPRYLSHPPALSYLSHSPSPAPILSQPPPPMSATPAPCPISAIAHYVSHSPHNLISAIPRPLNVHISSLVPFTSTYVYMSVCNVYVGILVEPIIASLSISGGKQVRNRCLSSPLPAYIHVQCSWFILSFMCSVHMTKLRSRLPPQLLWGGGGATSCFLEEKL